MNERKIQQLFTAARNASSPAAPADFAADVLRAVRREPVREAVPIFDQLNFLFPRIAVAAAVVIVLCVAADLVLTAVGLPEVGEGTTQVSSHFLFNAEEL